MTTKDKFIEHTIDHERPMTEQAWLEFEETLIYEVLDDKYCCVDTRKSEPL